MFIKLVLGFRHYVLLWSRDNKMSSSSDLHQNALDHSSTSWHQVVHQGLGGRSPGLLSRTTHSAPVWPGFPGSS